VSFTLSFAIRFDTIAGFLEQLYDYWPVFIPLLIIKLIIFDTMGLYRRLWRYASVRELIAVVGAVAFSSTLGGVVILILWVWPAPNFATGFPRSVIAIDAMLTLLLVGGIRFTARWRQETRSTAAQAESIMEQDQRALIAGAGDAGAMVAREMLRNPQVGYQLVGFLDDDPDKQGLRVHGMPVVGTLSDLSRCVADLQIEEILIAMPTAPGDAIRRIFDLARRTGVRVRTLPGYYELVSGQASVQRAREVRLEDLLRRAPAPMDLSGVAGYLTGQVVMVTGAGGSIGSEICRQVARFGPAQLLLLGHGEGSIYRIHMEMRRSFPEVTCEPVLANVRDREKLDWLIDHYRPEVIFHTAAYKHVPLSERNVDEVVLNNVIGTHNLVTAAEDAGVPHLVFVSTDKAVEPVNMMGMTKCVGEWIVQHAARRSGRAYVAVRFGNVLGSKGSVVPLFQKQIIAGGPVTVTHPEVTRYFMTIPEAVRLVLQAGALGEGGEVFVLDMGEPVRIYELACDLIHLYGMEPERDISIVFTGLRPGEKLHEALYTEAEAVQPTSHPDIRVATGELAIPSPGLEQALAEMKRLTDAVRRDQLRDYLTQLTMNERGTPPAERETPA
jgi:FlaA1/EpsC-like NDP-sugar epimerase